MAKIAMLSATSLRHQIEAELAHRIPSALSPMPRAICTVASTGVAQVDALLEGGLPIGAITEFVGPECSGRTSLAHSFLAGVTRGGNVGVWVDVCDAWDPESAAAAGVDLSRMLWVRCGVAAKQAEPANEAEFRLPEKYWTPPPVTKGLHGCGCGGHPRSEIKGLSKAVGEFLRPASKASQRDEPPTRRMLERDEALAPPMSQLPHMHSSPRTGKPWARIEQALRVVDLLLQAGGFAAIVLDMGSVAPEYALRIPFATWFRYRAAAERARACLLLLTQHSCAKSSGELLLRFQPAVACGDELTVLTQMECRIEVERSRFAHRAPHVISMRKPARRETGASWCGRPTWAGAR